MKRLLALLCIVLACGSGLVAGQPSSLTPDARATLLRQIDTLELRILALPTHVKPGLQGVLLYTSPYLLMEASPRLKLGGDLWGNARLPSEVAGALVELVADAGAFEQAAKFYSERGAPGATPPPAFAAPMQDRTPPADPITPAVQLGFASFDDAWSSTYEVTLPWDARTQQLWQDMRQALDADSGALLDAVRGTLDDPAERRVEFLGSFSQMRNTGEHAYIDELRLWRHEDALYGALLRQAGLIGDTPIEIEAIRIGGIDVATGELLAHGAVLGVDGRLSGDRIEGTTTDGERVVLERGSQLAALVPELEAATVRAIDAWMQELAASGRFVIHGN